MCGAGGFEAIVDLLLRARALTDGPGAARLNGTTPLHVAASLGHLGCVRHLLEASASLDAVSEPTMQVHALALPPSPFTLTQPPQTLNQALKPSNPHYHHHPHSHSHPHPQHPLTFTVLTLTLKPSHFACTLDPPSHPDPFHSHPHPISTLKNPNPRCRSPSRRQQW